MEHAKWYPRGGGAWCFACKDEGTLGRLGLLHRRYIGVDVVAWEGTDLMLFGRRGKRVIDAGDDAGF